MERPLQASSRASRTHAREALDDLVARSDVDVDGMHAAADDLFGAADLLDQQVRLRRVLTDDTREPASRVDLVRGLLASRIHPLALGLLEQVVGARWAHPRDLTDTVEDLAVELLAGAADREGHLDEVEDELFRFSRLVVANHELRAALTDPGLPAERKDGVITQLLGARVAAPTMTLIRRAVAHPRLPSVESVLDHYAEIVARRRARLLVRVRSAVALTAAQQHRLRERLAAMYARDVSLNAEVDPRVIGGVAVQVGDEVLDGTIASRLDGARQRLAGST